MDFRYSHLLQSICRELGSRLSRLVETSQGSIIRQQRQVHAMTMFLYNSPICSLPRHAEW